MAPKKQSEFGFADTIEKTWSDGKDKWTVRMWMQFDRRGLRITSLTLTPILPNGRVWTDGKGRAQWKESPPPAITGHLLRRLPLQRWLREHAVHTAREYRKVARVFPAAGVVSELTRAAKGPRASSMSFYGKVAEVYLAALPHGAPTKAVAEHFKVTRAVAASWVFRARKARLLGKTNQGEAAG